MRFFQLKLGVWDAQSEATCPNRSKWLRGMKDEEVGKRIYELQSGCNREKKNNSFDQKSLK